MKVTAAAAVASLGMASAFVTPGAFRAPTASLNKVRECNVWVCFFNLRDNSMDYRLVVKDYYRPGSNVQSGSFPLGTSAASVHGAEHAFFGARWWTDTPLWQGSRMTGRGCRSYEVRSVIHHLVSVCAAVLLLVPSSSQHHFGMCVRICVLALPTILLY